MNAVRPKASLPEVILVVLLAVLLGWGATRVLKPAAAPRVSHQSTESSR
jgi:hypothetical protein